MNSETSNNPVIQEQRIADLMTQIENIPGRSARESARQTFQEAINQGMPPDKALAAALEAAAATITRTG